MSARTFLTRGLFGCLVLFVAVHFVHFTRVHEFGLWEDDYWAIAPNLGKPLAGLVDLAAYTFKHWPQGRPLNHFLPQALAVVGSKLGGLTGAYIIAAAWLGLNACLVFAILRRLVPIGPAFAGALAYVLFPADTTKILLVHAAHIQGAMTFLLAGTWLWLRGGIGRWFAYGIAGLSLLAYETAFLPFLGIPLLLADDKRTTLRTWLVHLVACVALLAVVAQVRLRTGDSRANEALGSLTETIHRATTSLYLGPATSARSWGKGLQDGWLHVDAPAAWCGLLVVGCIAVFILLRPETAPRELPPRPSIWPAWLDAGRRPGELLPWWWLLGAGIVIWSGSYALTLINYPPTQLVGRFTSTHVAAAWPASLVVAAAASVLDRVARAARNLCLAGGLAAVFLLTSYHHYIQAEYVRTWHQEQYFWRDVLELAPEAEAGWTIIVAGNPAPSSPVIAANSWADYHVCRSIFGPNPQGAEAAFAHIGYLGPNIVFRQTAEGFTWKPQFWASEFVPIDPARLILLQSDGTNLWRIPEIATPVGLLHSTVTIPERGRRTWPDTPLSRLLFPNQYR